MKQSALQSRLVAALLGLALGATHLQAQNIARGRSFLKVEAYAEAYTEFLKETRLKPQDPEAQTLAGLANFVNITKSDSFNSFLDRLGFDKQGRELDDWTSAMDTEAMKERLKSEKMNGQELAGFIQNGLISNLEKSLNHFKAIPTGKSFLIFLSEQETQISDVYLDQGDVSMIQALIELICFTLNGVSAQDMHVDIQSILNLLDDKISADSFMSLNPDFMKNVSQNKLKAARASFIGFIDYYMKGSGLLQNRSTKHLNHLISIDEEQEELEADFQEHLNHLRFEESLNSLFQIEINESTITVSADPVHLFETPLRSLTRVDGLVGVIHQEAEQMATQLDRDIAKLSNISRARIIQPDIDGEGRMSDGADILLLQGDLQLARALSATLSAHDLNIGVQEIIKLRNQEKLDAQNILRTKPALLDLKTPSVMPRVRDWLANARQNLKDGYTLFQSRREGKVGIIIPDISLDYIIETLDTILAPEITTHKLSAPFKESNYLINPVPLWTGEVNLRNLLPRFDGNEPIQGTLPNSTMAGLFPDGIFINSESKIGQEPKPGDVIWEFKTGGPVQSSPAIGSDGTVYVGSNDNKVYALDGNTGTKKWEFKTGGKVYHSPAIGNDGTIYIGSLDNKFYAINPDGTKKWEFLTGGFISNAAISTDGTIYIGSKDATRHYPEWYGKAYALNPDGSIKWEFEMATSGGSPSIGQDGTVYIGSRSGSKEGMKLYALAKETGVMKWEVDTKDDGSNSPAIGVDGTVYVGSSENRNVCALNPENGTKIWVFEAQRFMNSAPAIGVDGTVYIGSKDVNAHDNIAPRMYALDGKTGALKWEFETGEDVESCPAIGNDGVIYVTSEDENIYALNGATGDKEWEFNLMGNNNISSPAIGSDGTIYVGSSDGHLYAFETSSSGPADSPWPMLGQNAQRTGATPLKPIITHQPTDQTASIGSEVEFVVKVTSAEPLEYQWYKEGQQIAGATDSTYRIASVSQADLGIYSVRLKNKVGKTYSQTVKLSLLVLHSLTVASRDPESVVRHHSCTVALNPADQNGQSDGTTQFTRVYAKGTEVTLTADSISGSNQFKQWLANGVPISTELTVTVTMDYDRTLRAVYLPIVEGQKIWEFQTGDKIYSSPAVGSDGTIYIGSYDNKVYALNGKTGAKLWEFETKGTVFSSPAIGRNATVYVGSWDGKVYALDRRTGNKRWEFETGRMVLSSPAIDDTDGTIYVGSHDRVLYAINGTTGAQRWAFKARGTILSSPAVGSDGNIYVGSVDKKLYCINRNTGGKKWEFQTDGQVNSSPAIGSNGLVYVGSFDGKVYALESDTGKVRWQFLVGNLTNTQTLRSSPAIGSDGTVFAAGYSLDGETGMERWPKQIDELFGRDASAAIGSDGTIYVGSRDKSLYAINPNGSKRWSFETQGEVRSSPAIAADGTIYVGSFDGKVYAFKSSSSGPADSPWPMFGQNNSRTSNGVERGPEPLRFGEINLINNDFLKGYLGVEIKGPTGTIVVFEGSENLNQWKELATVTLKEEDNVYKFPTKSYKKLFYRLKLVE